MNYIGYYYIFIPLLFIILVAVRRQTNKTQWLIANSPFAMVMVFLWVTARWEIPSIYLRNFFPFLFVLALIFSYKRIRPSTEVVSKFTKTLNLSINGIIFIVLAVMSTFALSGYFVSTEKVDLASPLRDGDFIVLHGGGRPFINAHAKISPQNYAIDIVAINEWGMRAKTIQGGDRLEDYEIFGENIYAPCEATVLVVVDGLKDQIPPKTDPKHPAGNHLLLDCGDFEILLAHLKNHTITVAVGDKITIDEIVGEVGNTGNTSEPHLHIHAEQGGKMNTILNGKGIPFTIDGRFLVRGDRL